MAIGKRAGSVLCAAAAVAAVVGLSATPALAATTLTAKVTSGGAITATAPTTTLTDGSVKVTCSTKGTTAASTASGTINNGTYKGTSPVKVGTTTKLAFNNCTGPLGAVTVKVQSTSMPISVDSTTSSGKTDGIISLVKVAVSMTACAFTVTGSAPGYYNNSNHTLNMTGTLPVKPLNSAQLTISGVSGCAGIVTNGQHPGYAATYTVKPSVSITVTTP